MRYPVALFDFANVKIPLVGAAWLLFVSIGKVVFDAIPRASHMFPESCVLIIVGVLLGIVLYFVEHTDAQREKHQLDPEIFFMILLPPIIIEAGYFMPSRLFFDQLGTIVLHAVAGTLLNAALIGFSLWGVGMAGTFGESVCLPFLHAMVFASLLAAVDPVAVLAIFEAIHVNEVLYIVIFGESLLNDGISVVLYHLFNGLGEIGAENVLAVDVVCGVLSFVVVIIGAVGIGVVVGLIGALLSRFTARLRMMEALVVIVVCYVSYLVGEMFHLSGILSCISCGITMNKYVEANISHKSRITLRYTMKILASVSESIIFMYLGIAAVSADRVWNTAFILLTLLFCLVYRALVVVFLTYFANCVRLIRMSAIDQFIMSYGGLRGAIAFALVSILREEKISSNELFVTTTIVVIFFTNLVLGGTMNPLVKLLRVKIHVPEEKTMNEAVASRVIDYVMFAVETISDVRGYHALRNRFSKFNNRYLKPILIRPESRFHRSGGHGSQILSVYRQLNVNDALQLAQPPKTAHSLHQWNASLRNISRITRSNIVNGNLPGLHYSNSSSSNCPQPTTDMSMNNSFDFASEPSHLVAGNVFRTGWSLNDSIDYPPQLRSPSRPNFARNRRYSDHSAGSGGVYCLDCSDVRPSSAAALTPIGQNGGLRPSNSRSSLAPLIATEDSSVTSSSSSRRRVRFDQLSFSDNTPSQSLDDGFSVIIDEIVPRHRPERSTLRGRPALGDDRHLTPRSPSDNIWSLTETPI